MATNLEFIKSVTLSSSTNFDITDVFTDRYDVYKIVYSQLALDTSTSSGASRTLAIRFFDSGGTIISQSEYDYANLDMRDAEAYSENKSTSTDKIYFVTQIDANARSGGVVMYIYNPNDSSSYTFTQFQGVGGRNDDVHRGYKGIGVHKSAETISGIRLFSGGGVSFNGIGTVYGVK